MQAVRLWLVEPDALLRDVLTEFFTQEGFAVQSCSSLLEVCEGIRFGEASLLVIDGDAVRASEDGAGGRAQAIDATAQQLLTISRLLPVLVVADDDRWQLHEIDAPEATYEVLPNALYDLALLERTVRALSQRVRPHSPHPHCTLEVAGPALNMENGGASRLDNGASV